MRTGAASSLTLPSGRVARNNGSGLGWPATVTSTCAIGISEGGNSRSALCVLNEEKTSHSTGPNISTTPKAR
jgi:hypothetical protein